MSLHTHLDPADYLGDDGLIDHEAHAEAAAAERWDALRAMQKEDQW